MCTQCVCVCSARERSSGGPGEGGCGCAWERQLHARRLGQTAIQKLAGAWTASAGRAVAVVAVVVVAVAPQAPPSLHKTLYGFTRCCCCGKRWRGSASARAPAAAQRVGADHRMVCTSSRPLAVVAAAAAAAAHVLQQQGMTGQTCAGGSGTAGVVSCYDGRHKRRRRHRQRQRRASRVGRLLWRNGLYSPAPRAGARPQRQLYRCCYLYQGRGSRRRVPFVLAAARGAMPVGAP